MSYFEALRRAPISVIAPLGTDANKEFLTTAPWLVVVFLMLQADDGGVGVVGREIAQGVAGGRVAAGGHHIDGGQVAGAVALFVQQYGLKSSKPSE